MEKAAPQWSLRPAAYDDGETLAAIVAEAARDQGAWPEMTQAEEAEWHAASSHGVVDLGVEHANAHARRLYERLGFVPFASDEQELHLRWLPG
jgi:ribosomal protein S18 acetylase RimI-like enzyme